MPESATLEAPAGASAVPAAQPTHTPGPKPFDRATDTAKSLDQSLLDQAGPGTTLPPKKPAAKVPDKPAEGKVPEKPAEAPKPGDVAKPQDVPHGTGEPEKGKFNPVKELKTARSRITELETKLRDTEGRITPEVDRQQLTSRMEQIQKRNEELENLVRFKSYEHSKEFQDKYHAPYERALSSAMADLSRIPVMGADGQTRAGTQNDLFEIVNLANNDIVAARKRANEVFGEAGPDVMDMAKKVRDTLLSRNEALAEERKNGAQRELAENENRQRLTKEQQKALETEYLGMVKAVAEDPEDPYFKPLVTPFEPEEGKELTPEQKEHNELLERGYKEIESWIGQHPSKAKTKEEREQIIKQHLKIRAKYAAFDGVRALAKRWRSRAKEAEKKLAAYEETAPTTGGRKPNGGQTNGKTGKLTDSIDWDNYRR